MKNTLLLICMLGGMLAPASAPAWAWDANRPVVPCAHPMFRALDFWVGDWTVYHRESGRLAGFDRVGRILKGCAIQQTWVSLDDHFSSPMVPFRMNGKSLTAFNGEQWVQFWVDNQAGSQIIKGGVEGKKFVLTSESPVMGHIYKLSWEKEKDGAVHHMARRRKVDEETWIVLFDFIYRRNVNQMSQKLENTPEKDQMDQNDDND